MDGTGTPVIFIHGLWLHPSSWAPWLELFSAAGYRPLAPGWPGVPETVELARANPDGNSGRGPLLLVMGGQDHTVPEAITKSALKQYRHSGAVTDLAEFPDRGHSLIMDSGWRSVAEECLAWLGKQGR